LSERLAHFLLTEWLIQLERMAASKTNKINTLAARVSIGTEPFVAPSKVVP
jgi:hypothetical protein